MTENETLNTPASPEPVGDVTDTTTAPEVQQEAASQEAPAAEPVADAPSTEAPAATEPVTEVPVESTPEAPTSVDQASEPASEPVAEAPVAVEAPAAEAPAAETPAEAPAAEPVAEAAVAEAVTPPAAPEAIAGSVVESQPTSAAVPAVESAPVAEAPPAPALSDMPLLQANEADARTLQGLKEITDAYVAKMGAAVPVNPIHGAQHQQGLFKHIESMLKLDGMVFTRAWSDFLAKVHAERDGAFHESRVFRFFDQIKLDTEQSRVFQNLLHLVIHTADPKGRQTALKHLDLGSVTKGIAVPGATDKIIGYYSQQ